MLRLRVVVGLLQPDSHARLLPPASIYRPSEDPLLPPRYLLRENVVVNLVKELAPKRFAEIGCGAGELLARLASLGFEGVGYDLSEMVRNHARARLAQGNIRSIEIVDEFPENGKFDVVLLLEVLGYLEDPHELLRRCRDLLTPSGRLIVSYARAGAGYDSRVVAGMNFFTRDEVTRLLLESGLKNVRQINYGYPLANALVGLNNRVYNLRLALRKRALEVEETAVAHTWPWLKPAALVSNRLTMKPFFWAQRFSADTNLGNGYVAFAERA